MKFSLWPRRRAARFNHRAHLEGVLGTALELQIVASFAVVGPQIEAAILAEIDRLEAIFSLYRLDSEFNIWQQTRDVDAQVSPELAEVLSRSEAWRECSHGAFNPAVEVLTQRWKSASQSGRVPDAGELRLLAREINAPLWSVDRENLRARRLTFHRASLNGVAKGYIVDRACDVARAHAQVAEVLVNIGGDLRHVGAQTLPVCVADPWARADNAPPATRVKIGNSSLATSGRARRGFLVGERWFSHVIDARDGQPVARTVSASVVAANALDADVLATICSVLAPDEALKFAELWPDVGIFLVSESGHIVSNAAWRALEM